jgi:TfoX/Sxy family transcriptional regulator of competence genes
MDKYLIRTIIIMMTSIGQVEYRMHEEFTGIYREGILFAKIHDEGVYLLNNQNTFIKIDKEEEIKDQLRQAYNLALISA